MTQEELNMNFQETIKQRHSENLRNHDKIVFSILLAHLPVTMFLIPIGYDTQAFAVVSSLLVGLAAAAGYFLTRGTRWFGVLAGVLLMCFSAIMIQTQMGRLEMHFHIFGALALLLIYRDWLAIVAAAGAIAVHHLLLTALQLNAAQLGDMPVMIYNYGCSWGIFLMHAAFVVFESAILVYYALLMKKEEVTGLQLIAAVTEVHRQNNLSIRLPGDDNNKVACAFNNLVEKFDGLISSLGSASQNLETTARELNVNNQETSQNISIQHDQIAEAVTAMTEMSNTIHAVAQNSQQAAASASEADTEAHRGAKLVNEAVAKTGELLNSMNTAADAMNQLEQNVENIGSVVDVIRGISEQTNLLALNAAIEAARAGEQGRGFAVVADEVRTLAQRTQESTTEIQDIIESFQAVTAKAVGTINEGQQRTHATSDEISEAGKVLESIVEDVAKISNMNLQIATAAEEQASVADSISENISSLSNLSQDAVSKVESNLQASEQLQSMSNDMNQDINVFKT